MAIGGLGAVSYDIVANDHTAGAAASSERNLMAVGAVMTGVGLAAVAMTRDIKSSFLEFDTAMVEVKALGGLTEDEFNRMRGAALDLSKQMPVTATDFANAMYLMVSVGYDYQTMMNTVPEAAELAVAGSMSLAEATNSIINVLGAYGDKAGEAADITKVFANAVGVGKYEMSDFMTEIMKNIGVASQLGISFSDLAAYNVSLQNSFTSAEEAGTSFNRMLIAMTTTGAAKLQEMGIALTDSNGKFRDLTDIMAELKVKLADVQDEQERLAIVTEIFGTFGQRAAIAIMNQTEALPELKQQMAEMDLIQTQFNTKMEGTATQLEIAENKMEAAKIALGEGMAPAMILTADAAGVLADVLETLPGPLQAVGGMGIYAAQGLAAIGPALMGIAALKTLGLGGLLTTISASLAGLGASASGYAAAAGTAIAGSLVAAIGIGIAAGMAGVWVMAKTGILDGISDIGRAIESSPIGGVIMDALKIALLPLAALGTIITDLVTGNLKRIPEDLNVVFSQAGQAVSNFANTLRTSLGGMNFSAVIGSVTSLFSGIGSAFNAMGNQVKGVFSQLVNAILNIFTMVQSGFRQAGSNIITSLVQGILDAAAGVVNAVKGVLDKVRALFPFSPAKEGPLAETPNWGTWMSQGMEKAGPEVAAAASSNLAAPVAAGAVAGAAGGAGAGAGGGGSTSITISPGAIVINGAGQNADEIANQVIAKLSQQMASTRKARGLIA
jgi:TP901 family phage tail tape measure protein